MTDAEINVAQIDIAALIARKIMGWELTAWNRHWVGGGHFRSLEKDWNPLHRIGQAFMVVDKMVEDGWCFQLRIMQDELCSAQFWNRTGEDISIGGLAINEDKSRAICLAVARAKGVEV